MSQTQYEYSLHPKYSNLPAFCLKSLEDGFQINLKGVEIKGKPKVKPGQAQPEGLIVSARAATQSEMEAMYNMKYRNYKDFIVRKEKKVTVKKSAGA